MTIQLKIFSRLRNLVVIFAIVQQLLVTHAVEAFAPPSNIVVKMYHLTNLGEKTRDLCLVGDTEYYFGCAAEGQGGYPYNANPMTLSFEKDYLLDVVPRELPNYYDSVAIQAQAVAARTYAYWHINQGSPIDNSNSYQVFAPGTFRSLGNGFWSRARPVSGRRKPLGARKPLLIFGGGRSAILCKMGKTRANSLPLLHQCGFKRSKHLSHRRNISLGSAGVQLVHA